MLGPVAKHKSKQTTPRTRTGARKPAKPKAQRTAARAANTSSPRVRTAPARRVTPAAQKHQQREPEPAVDARVAAVIALALHDEEACTARERELAAPPSAWTLAGRARRMQTRWTR
jgi:hypothetical protein